MWIDAKKQLPPKCIDNSDESIEVLISDGENIGMGYHEYEYFGDDPDDPISYSSAVWHDDTSNLNTCVSGFAEVTHWMPLPPSPNVDHIEDKLEMIESISSIPSKYIDDEIARDLEYINMVGGINPELLGPAEKMDNHIRDATEMLDKDSTTYFMTQMTQEEFDKRRGDSPIVSHEFNKIKS